MHRDAYCIYSYFLLEDVQEIRSLQQCTATRPGRIPTVMSMLHNHITVYIATVS